jgi:2-deoxy-D-gluconate 3-dehydrogenase
VDWLSSEGHVVDILINNAGTIRRAQAAEHTDEDWDTVLEVNLTAPFVLARGLGKQMLERGNGKVVFVSSILGFQGGVTVPSYAATKSALIGLTKALANEWAGQGVNVNAIAPGYIRTDNTQTLQDDAERSNAIATRIPAGDWGAPDDIAGTAVYLASPAASYVHGTVVTVDGGWMGR